MTTLEWILSILTGLGWGFALCVSYEYRATLRKHLAYVRRDAAAWDRAVVLSRKSCETFDTFWWNTFVYSWHAIGLQRRIDAAGLVEDHEACDAVCSGCLNPIDLSTCHCGSAADDHYEEHHPVPMGCICHSIPWTNTPSGIQYWKDRCAHAEALTSGREWIEPPPLRGEQEDPF